MEARVAAELEQLKLDQSNKKKTTVENATRLKECTYKAFKSCDPSIFNGKEGATGVLQWLEESESVLEISKCNEEDKVKFAAQQFKGEALLWWKAVVQMRRRDVINRITWEEFKEIVKEKYCSINDIERIETEFLSLEMVASDLITYVS